VHECAGEGVWVGARAYKPSVDFSDYWQRHPELVSGRPVGYFVESNSGLTLCLSVKKFRLGHSYNTHAVICAAHDSLAVIGRPVGIERNTLYPRPILVDRAHALGSRAAFYSRDESVRLKSGRHILWNHRYGLIAATDGTHEGLASTL
jgi:hypothetical protein